MGLPSTALPALHLCRAASRNGPLANSAGRQRPAGLRLLLDGRPRGACLGGPTAAACCPGVRQRGPVVPDPSRCPRDALGPPPALLHRVQPHRVPSSGGRKAPGALVPGWNHQGRGAAAAEGRLLLVRPLGGAPRGVARRPRSHPQGRRQPPDPSSLRGSSPPLLAREREAPALLQVPHSPRLCRGPDLRGRRSNLASTRTSSASSRPQQGGHHGPRDPPL